MCALLIFPFASVHGFGVPQRKGGQGGEAGGWAGQSAGYPGAGGSAPPHVRGFRFPAAALPHSAAQSLPVAGPELRKLLQRPARASGGGGPEASYSQPQQHMSRPPTWVWFKQTPPPAQGERVKWATAVQTY